VGLRLARLVLAQNAARAGLPRVDLFYTSVDTAATAEVAARGQRGAHGQLSADPWKTAPLSPTDRAAIRAYLELLRDNERLSPAVRGYVRSLVAAGRVS
jgi:hypothetical protein